MGSLARLPVTIGLAAAGSLAVETLQHMLALGRVSSIDDVLLNAAGVGVTVQVTRRSWRMHKTAQSRPASAASAAQLAA